MFIKFHAKVASTVYFFLDAQNINLCMYKSKKQQ